MSLTVSLSNAVSGLWVNQKAIEVASHNIANANTPGYSRQTVNRETVVLAGQGGGVKAGSITRSFDDYVVRELRQQTGVQGEYAVRSDYFSRMQDLFGSPDSNSSLTARLSDLATRLETLSIEPDSATRQRDVVNAAATFARDLNAASRTIQDLRRQADQDIHAAVGEINGRLAAIAELNAAIVRDTALGRPTGDLLDSRDRAVGAVAELMDIQYYTRDTGEMVVYAGSGQPLVDRTAQRLEYTPAAIVSPAASFDQITINGTPIDGHIGSGRLRALLEMRDTALPGLQGQFDSLAGTVRDTLNLVHNRGTAIPAPSALTGSRTFADVTAEQVTLSSPVRIAVLDDSGIVQQHFDLPAGTYTVAGVRDALTTGLGGAATASVANGGGLTISATNSAHGIAIVDLSAPVADTTVTHTVGGTDREYAGFSNFFGLNDLFATDATGAAASIAVRADIAADPSRLARGRLDTAATLVPGQSIGVTTGDSSTARALADAFDQAVSFPAIGGLPATSSTLTDFASQILSTNATRASDSKGRLEYQDSVVQDLSFKAASVSGVNIDEEMANLVTYQNAYAASARLVSVVSEMLETLTNLR